jgi:hypothetical protein
LYLRTFFVTCSPFIYLSIYGTFKPLSDVISKLGDVNRSTSLIVLELTVKNRPSPRHLFLVRTSSHFFFLFHFVFNFFSIYLFILFNFSFCSFFIFFYISLIISGRFFHTTFSTSNNTKFCTMVVASTGFSKSLVAAAAVVVVMSAAALDIGFFYIFPIFSLFNLLFLYIFHIISHFSIFSISFHNFLLCFPYTYLPIYLHFYANYKFYSTFASYFPILMSFKFPQSNLFYITA